MEDSINLIEKEILRFVGGMSAKTYVKSKLKDLKQAVITEYKFNQDETYNKQN